MKHPLKISTTFKLPVIGLLALLTACSSGSDSDTDSTATVSGAIVAAPVAGAQVSVVDASGNIVVDAVTTDADGLYSLSIPAGSLGQELIIASSGGSFIDEATGNAGTAGSMFAYMAANSINNGSSVSVTPGSTIIASLVLEHGKTMTEAQTIFADTFGYTPDVSVLPVDATIAPAADVSDAEKLSGLRAAAFSQLAMDLGLSQNDQFDMFAALARDLSDGVLDGVDASGPVVIDPASSASPVLPADIQNRFVIAMETFHGGGRNMTGLTNDQIGNLPFARVALTDSYKIEYVEGAMAAMEGKSMFKLRVTDKATGLVGQAGLALTLMPMMHMAEHMHSSPDMDCVEDLAVAGDYDCTVYYLMASAMADGTSMGYWTLMVTLEDTVAGTSESAMLYPEVMMAMGDTAKVTLKGGMTTDVIPGMLGDMSRSYFIFKESLSGTTGAHDFTMFVAAMESMSSYPAVSDGTVLNAGAGAPYELIATPMTVEVSTDAVNWVLATDNTNGKWSASSIAGLVDGTAGTIYVRLTINGEQKTMDGLTPAGDGTNDYGMFFVTPGGM